MNAMNPLWLTVTLLCFLILSCNNSNFSQKSSNRPVEKTTSLDSGRQGVFKGSGKVVYVGDKASDKDGNLEHQSDGDQATDSDRLKDLDDEKKDNIENEVDGSLAAKIKSGGMIRTQKIDGKSVAINPCEGLENKNYKFLILDLKSGWFSGDGGDFFKISMKPVCGGSVRLDYIHITRKKIETNMGGNLKNLLSCPDGKQNCTFKSLDSYISIWLLSGDNRDKEDIPTDSGTFLNFISQVHSAKDKNPKISFLISAGLGNVDHANHFGKKVFPNVFTNNLYEATGARKGSLPNPKFFKSLKSLPLVNGDGITRGTVDQEFILFDGIKDTEFASKKNSIYDYKPDAKASIFSGILYNSKCFTDRILNTSGHKVATDHCGRLAVSHFQTGNHSILLEGNTARFYQDIDYLKRIVLFLIPLSSSE